MDTVRNTCPCGAPAPVKCSACRSAFYCSGTCQKEDWPTHKSRCRLIQSSVFDGKRVSERRTITFARPGGKFFCPKLNGSVGKATEVARQLADMTSLQRKSFVADCLKLSKSSDMANDFVRAWACVPNAEMVKYSLAASPRGLDLGQVLFTVFPDLPGEEEVFPLMTEEVLQEFQSVLTALCSAASKRELGVHAELQALPLHAMLSALSPTQAAPIVQAFLAGAGKKVDINALAPAPADQTPLQLASMYCGAETVRLLLKAGADHAIRCPSNEQNALHMAVTRDREDGVAVIRALVEAGIDIEAVDDTGSTPLLVAAGVGEVGAPLAFEELLLLGASPAAFLRPTNEVDGKTHEKGNPSSAICWMARNNDAVMLERVLSMKIPGLHVDTAVADFWKHGKGTCMHVAAQNDAPAAMAVLLKHGAAVSPVNREQQTPLSLAITANPSSPRCVRLLLKHGAMRARLPGQGTYVGLALNHYQKWQFMSSQIQSPQLKAPLNERARKLKDIYEQLLAAAQAVGGGLEDPAGNSGRQR